MAVASARGARCALLLSALLLGAAATAGATTRPNFVFIIADDLYVDMLNYTATGQGKNFTPQLDRLAAEGTVMTDQHIVSPVCTPSRYNCLTGRYASRATNPMFTRQTGRAGTTIVAWNSKITPSDVTLPQLLRAAGYVTGIAGKQHVVDVPDRRRPAADADPRAPEVRAQLAHNERVERAALAAAGFDKAGGIYHGNPDELSPAALRVHNMDWVAQAGVDFVARHAGKGRPFFLYFAPTLAHSPYTPDRSWNADPRMTPYGVLDTPPDVLPSREDRARRLREHPSPGRHRENLLWLDDAIRALWRQLEATGELERTVIVFFNDNGQDGKGSIYQSAAWSPSVVWRQGGFAVGRTCAVRVTNLDFAPTILDLAGVVAPPGHFDGRSFRPALEGRTDPLHESVYFELGFTRGVRVGDWKYLALRYPPQPERFALVVDPPHLQGFQRPAGQPAFGHIGGNNNELAALRTQPAYFERDQLYDLASDPREQRNLAADPRQAAILAELQRTLQRHLSRLPGGFGEFKLAP
jgi:arylsulfatase A-like enzyme